MSVDVKICGLKDAEAVQAAVAGGAKYIGFVFYPPSPRAVTVDMAAHLVQLLPTHVQSVGLYVDPGDKDLARILAQVPLDLIQLHGAETPARVREIRARFQRPVMKALRIATAEDVAAAPAYTDTSDLLLFDAKPPSTASLPGGNAVSFDWSLLSGTTWLRPWMLAGGLNAGNLTEAVRMTGTKIVDVSSGVEDAPGLKSATRIREFLALAQRL